MTYYVSGGTLNLIYSFTKLHFAHFLRWTTFHCFSWYVVF